MQGLPPLWWCWDVASPRPVCGFVRTFDRLIESRGLRGTFPLPFATIGEWVLRCSGFAVLYIGIGEREKQQTVRRGRQQP